MKVLVVHNYYQQPGGEDVVFESEAALLEARGHVVLRYTKHNDQVADFGPVALARRAVWNADAHREIRDLVRTERPDILHVHNTLPLISPSIYSAAVAENVPVVQTLHNYRLICPNAVLFRSGEVCEECVHTKTAWPSVVHGCYRNSRSATTVVAMTHWWHRSIGTWSRHVDQYIALSEFSRQKYIEGGFPPEKISLKPNFVDPDPGLGDHQGGYALFVGRLERGKGIETMLSAVERVSTNSLRLKIVGDGPLRPPGGGETSRIEWLGYMRDSDEIQKVMKSASMLIFPSEFYEGCPMTAIEAFATGLPVVAARRGAMSEMVADGRTGLHFEPGSAEDLASKLEWALGHRDEMRSLGLGGRKEFERCYSADRHYERLLQIYRAAASQHATQGQPS